MTAKIKTKALEISEPLNELIERGKFISPNSPEITALIDQIKLLAHADYDEALKLEALVLHLTGNLAGALKALGEMKVYDEITHFIILTNFSRCREAQLLFARYGAPKDSQFSFYARFAFAIGAFNSAAKFVPLARSMRLTNLDSLPLEKIMAASALLNEFGVTDSKAAEIMEVAGDVLRSRGLMFQGAGPRVDVIDVPGELRTVHLTYEVAAAPSAAASMVFDFIDLIEERRVSLPGAMHVSFAGTCV